MQAQNKSVPGVGAILLHEGRFLLQLRDDKPHVSHPNMWGLVGGGIEEGEEPWEAIRRECLEEIGIIPNGLVYIGHTSDSKYRFYAHLNKEETESLILGEGQEIRFFAPDEIPQLHTTPRVKVFFSEYRHVVTKFINEEVITAVDMDLEA
jgi:8-oxo-dGTP pyrophosphatase MutT (NUDIX family)